MSTPAYFTSLQVCANAQAKLNLIRVAIALERHFIKNGGYPESLQELEFPPTGGIPLDVASGTPPHYTRTSAKRFTLYYEGWNCADDGGAVDMENGKLVNNSLKGDWVWPMPQE